MEWLNEWAKPAVIIVAIGVFATCGNNAINQRFDSIDNRLLMIDERTFEMNTRLSHIEGKLEITVNVPNAETPPSDIKK